MTDPKKTRQTVIWKYPFDSGDPIQEFNMPADARILHVGVQQRTVCLWALIPDPDAPTEHRTFQIVGTGHQDFTEERAVYLGTVALTAPSSTTVLTGGITEYVWHLFELTDRRMILKTFEDDRTSTTPLETPARPAAMTHPLPSEHNDPVNYTCRGIPSSILNATIATPIALAVQTGIRCPTCQDTYTYWYVTSQGLQHGYPRST